MIKLIFAMFLVNQPENMITQESDRAFESVESCKGFVNSLVQQELTWKDGDTRFVSVDGYVFFVRCVEAS